MDIRAFDHIVLVVADVAASCAFYSRVLGMTPVEYPPGKWSLHFGQQKISLQQQGQVPAIARQTTPGSANFCLISATPMASIVDHLTGCGVALIAGPARKEGATGPLLSVYFYDIDGNLVEIANRIV